MKKQKVLTIIGPTASGKTELSVRAAEIITRSLNKQVEIVSADSRQVYKHIPVASAQPPRNILKKYRHYFIDELELDEEFNAGEFGKRGREIINNILAAGKIPVIAGGSGLYIDSLINGLFDYEELSADKEWKQNQALLRQKLYDKLNQSGLQMLTDELKQIDPETVSAMDHVTERRVIRALEVYYLTGIPISVHRSNKIKIDFSAVKIGINMNREELYERINQRTDKMIDYGLIDEVMALKKKGYHYSTMNSLNTVGIKEVFDFLDGKLSLEEAVNLIKQNTRRFAKRQMTWFRRYDDINWIDADGEIEKLVNREIVNSNAEIRNK